MPKFRVEYGLDVPAYGEVEMNADSVEDLIKAVKVLHDEDTFIQGWDTLPENGCENERVVHIFVSEPTEGGGERWVPVHDGYSLGEEDYFEEGPKLWIAYDDDSGAIIGHSTDRAAVLEAAEDAGDCRILGVKL